MKLLAKAIEDKQYVLDLKARDMPTIIGETVERMVAHGAIPAEAADDVKAAVNQREEAMSTAIGNAVAIPHGYLEACPNPVIVFVRLARPVNLGAPDRIPTRFLFFLIGPPGAAEIHLDLLANIARLMADDEFRFDAGQARNGQALIDAMQRFVARTSPAAQREQTPDESLQYTGRFAGGLIDDLRRRLPHYASDFRDGLSGKCLGSTLFLFFACLAPAITFGGVMAVQTGGMIGTVEMLAASAVCGVVYALVAGQPLIILGGTGPLLIFTAVLYRLCGDLSIPFLPAYAWVGLWSAAILVILALLDVSALMRFFTRFTDETFAALISLIFIYEAIRALIVIFHDLDVKKHHDTALLSVLLALGTFYIAMSLSGMRKSRYLLPKLREFLADFGPTIALAAMTGIAVWLHEVDLDTLAAPDKLGTTNGRPWLVDLFDVPVWVMFAAAGPAALATVLMYLDQNITARLVNSPDHKLRKGAAYHLDLGVVGLLMAACSLFGLPWLVAATVRSLNHLRSLATSEEVTTSGGTRDRILHVRETRVTGLAIHLLVGLSLLLLPLLKSVPMAVLYGLFLFMGVVSMAGNQFFERMRLWAMEPASYPATHYIRRVPVWTVHKFTLVQLACLVVLWVVKVSAWAIVFPLFIALTVPVRLLLNRIMSPEHLEALDAEEEPSDDATSWAG
jgi:mannitol/fructose-specific phosphotransferase system IIA component (Ntr-type)